MPKTKQFDVDTALNCAMETFWKVGYEATSMAQLLQAMGINRGSFYDTFESKRDVLLAALERYQTQGCTAMASLIAETQSPRQTILDIFVSHIDPKQTLHGMEGCFMVNTASEVAPHDEEVAGIVRTTFGKWEDAFCELLKKGIKAGEMSAKLNARQTARALVSQMLGLMVLVRAGAAMSTRRSIVKHVESLLV